MSKRLLNKLFRGSDNNIIQDMRYTFVTNIHQLSDAEINRLLTIITKDPSKIASFPKFQRLSLKLGKSIKSEIVRVADVRKARSKVERRRDKEEMEKKLLLNKLNDKISKRDMKALIKYCKLDPFTFE